MLAALISIMMLASCTQTVNDKTAPKETYPAIEKTMKVAQVLESSDLTTNDTIYLNGTVIHTCRHSGKRIFLSDDGNNQIKVEAAGKIGGFNQELVGSQIIVKGILRETKVTEEMLNEMEVAEEEIGSEGKSEPEHCETESKGLDYMRKKLAASDKGYVSVYYVDGIDFKEITHE